jgi:hypothetical protein
MLAVEINRTTINFFAGLYLEITVVVFSVAESVIAIIFVESADQNPIPVVEWHISIFALIRVIEKQ